MKHNTSYERCMFNQMKPIFATCFLHILQGQTLAFHTLISLLNSCKDSQFLIFLDTMTHSLGPTNLTDWMPQCVVFIFSLLNWLVSERRLLYGSRKSNICFIISGDKLLFTLKISVTRTCKFLWCIATALPSSSSLLKDRFLFLHQNKYTNHNARSRILLVVLFSALL